MLTAEQILKDIKTDKVKKVIIDGDFSAECDDQYTLAYALGCDKMNVVGVNASAHFDDKYVDTYSTMLKSYAEMLRVLHASGIDRNNFPCFMGSSTQVSHNIDFAPSDSPAARNIIKVAKEAAEDEIIYIITTGPCSCAVSAYLMDPSIADKICVVWLGGNEISERTMEKGCHEWNMYADFKASQILLSSDIPLLMLNAGPHGSGNIVMTYEDFQTFGSNWDGPWVEQFYSRVLPRTSGVTLAGYTHGWSKVMCDYAGAAAISIPDSMDLTIIPAPTLEDDGRYTLNPNNKLIIWGENPDSNAITADAIKCTKALIQRAKEQ
ncbi:MAG: nucleoside hydrolase [Clostridia bacterium]|nr:nucleoside hydrolase [Clostridia bacterium]